MGNLSFFFARRELRRDVLKHRKSCATLLR
jgi:hypothetical protein